MSGTQIAGAGRASAGTLPGLLAAAVAEFGERPWMHFEGETKTYAELGADVDRIGAALTAAGLGRGETAGLFLGNCFEWLELEYAVGAVGARLVPLNTWFRSRELAHIFAQSGLELLVWDSEILGQGTLDLLLEMVPELERGGPGEWRSERFPRLRTVVGFGAGPWPPGVVSWEDLLAAVPAERPQPVAVDPADPALVIFTSGTTGTPKGAILSHGAVVGHMREWTDHLGLGPEDSSIMASPLFWTFGCTMNAAVPLFVGSSIALLERFAARPFLRAMLDLGVSHLQGVPTQYEMALAEADEDDDLSGIRVIQLGGSASAEDLAVRLLRRAPEAKIISAYGLTEAVAVSTWTEPDDPLADATGTVGHVSPDLEGGLRDPVGGAKVPTGEVGELWLRGPSVMSGYIGGESGVDADGWLHTGDLMRADERGYLTVVGRSVDAFKRGGMNVYPAETELLLIEHPAVRGAAIVGVPDERLGEVGAAFVVLDPEAEASAAELVGWCEERLARYKVPAHVRFVDELPLTLTGKVKKYEVRKLWDEGSSL
jgi:acyl-CoA synthetase (AMP-forming)/AMP-acid ligase II